MSISSFLIGATIPAGAAYGPLLLGLDPTSKPRGLNVDASGNLITSQGATTSGGPTPNVYVTTGLNNQDSQIIKASAGQVYSFRIYSQATTPRYVKWYNKGQGNLAPTSADTPCQVDCIPAASSGSWSGVVAGTVGGQSFPDGISFRVTQNLIFTDATAAAANDVVINFSVA